MQATCVVLHALLRIKISWLALERTCARPWTVAVGAEDPQSPTMQRIQSCA